MYNTIKEGKLRKETVQLDMNLVNILQSNKAITGGTIFSIRQYSCYYTGSKKIICSLPILYTFTQLYRIQDILLNIGF